MHISLFIPRFGIFPCLRFILFISVLWLLLPTWEIKRFRKFTMQWHCYSLPGTTPPSFSTSTVFILYLAWPDLTLGLSLTNKRNTSWSESQSHKCCHIKTSSVVTDAHRKCVWTYKVPVELILVSRRKWLRIHINYCPSPKIKVILRISPPYAQWQGRKIKTFCSSP